MNTLDRTLRSISSSYNVHLPISNGIARLLTSLDKAAKFRKSGWFPHRTFPEHLLGNDDETILNYYRENWLTVKSAIENELSECHIDNDAKDAVRQALIAHENGLYRLIPAPLFTEVERVVRVTLFDDQVGSISVKNLLVGLIGSSPFSAMSGRMVSFVGFNLLDGHLYENIHTDSVRERFSKASIPNRHAAIHGLVVYSSEKNSLNAIFVAMYVFRELTALALKDLHVT